MSRASCIVLGLAVAARPSEPRWLRKHKRSAMLAAVAAVMAVALVAGGLLTRHSYGEAQQGCVLLSTDTPVALTAELIEDGTTVQRFPARPAARTCSSARSMQMRSRSLRPGWVRPRKVHATSGDRPVWKASWPLATGARMLLGAQPAQAGEPALVWVRSGGTVYGLDGATGLFPGLDFA
jgi:hypothetical protein